MSKLSSRGARWEALRQAVLERDQYTCAYCQNHATTADHVIPKAMGGMDSLENLVAACGPCNGRKGARSLIRTTGWNPRWLDGLT